MLTETVTKPFHSNQSPISVYNVIIQLFSLEIQYSSRYTKASLVARTWSKYYEYNEYADARGDVRT